MGEGLSGDLGGGGIRTVSWRMLPGVPVCHGEGREGRNGVGRLAF